MDRFTKQKYLNIIWGTDLNILIHEEIFRFSGRHLIVTRETNDLSRCERHFDLQGDILIQWETI